MNGHGGKLRRKDFIHSAVAGLLIFSALLNFYFIYMNFNRNRVTRVVDGDSFETKDGRRIRLDLSLKGVHLCFDRLYFWLQMLQG